MELTDFEELR